MSRHLKITRAMQAIAHCEYMIRELRPLHAWTEVHIAINMAYPETPITIEKLLRSVHHLVDEGMMPSSLLETAPSKRRGETNLKNSKNQY